VWNYTDQPEVQVNEQQQRCGADLLLLAQHRPVNITTSPAYRHTGVLPHNHEVSGGMLNDSTELMHAHADALSPSPRPLPPAREKDSHTIRPNSAMQRTVHCASTG
jgi:hypothetical protein